MTKKDILSAAAVYGSQFVRWIDFIIDEEASIRNGIIIPENDHDGQGVTFCGLTQASDGLDLATLSPSWVAGSYFSGKIPYWKAVAGLPSPLLECVANWRVNMGLGGAARVLQSALAARGSGIYEDGQIGPATLLAANADTNTRDLCRACVVAADAHYRAIVARIPARAYALSDWLRRNQHLLARFVDIDPATPEDATAVIATPAVPRAPAPRSVTQIMNDLQVTPVILT